MSPSSEAMEVFPSRAESFVHEVRSNCHTPPDQVTRFKSRPERGRATIRSKTLNQRGQVVQELTARLVVFRRPAAER